MSTIAAIDVGTNSVLLTIAQRTGDGAIETLLEAAQITRIGEGIGSGGPFLPAAMARTIAVLTTYAARCRECHVEKIFAVGTAAFRRATNAETFIAQVAQQTGLSLDIISGEREAALSYLAATHDFGRDALVLDIGGGSTEFIWDGAGTLHAFSLALGSVALHERYVHTDPISAAEVIAIQRAIEDTIAAAPSALPHRRQWQTADPQLIALAGSATTLAAMHRQLRVYSHADVHGTRLTHTEVARLFDALRTRTIAERIQLPGLEPKRADVILTGTMILLTTMQRCGFDTITISDRGVRWGLIYEALRV